MTPARDPLVYPAAERSSELALIEGDRGQSVTYAELFDQVDALAEALHAPGKRLVFCLADASFAAVRGYLASLRAGHAVALLDPALDPQRLQGLIEHYRPDYLVSSLAESRQHYAAHPRHAVLAVRESSDERDLHPELAVLLSTSGSTGSPKLVRLSLQNVRSNAAAIAQYLGIDAGERAIASLPLSYAYGLSVLNSHLYAGASVVLTSESILSRQFWQVFDAQRCSSFAGVPYTYEILDRTRMLQAERPTLRTLTQAGGRMRPPLVEKLHAHMLQRGARLFVMYGQTEATARIAYVPPSALGAHPDSIGVPIPGGRLEVHRDGEPVATPREVGELVYYGPNVMLGYASGPADLAAGDELGGRLYTGDLGYFDEGGLFYVSGRKKRIVKLFGRRVSLDEVEADARANWGGLSAAVGADERMVIFFEGDGGEDEAAARRQTLVEQYRLHHSCIKIQFLPSLPITPNGKPDYRLLGEKLT